MNIVRCNYCMSVFNEYEIMKADEHCPNCGRHDALMDVEHGCYFTQSELESLWGYFADTPINDRDEIEEEFIGFPVSTNRFDIWHWFDERYKAGVYALAYGKDVFS